MQQKDCKTKKIGTFREAYENNECQIWLNNHVYGLVRISKKKNVIESKWMQVVRSWFKDCLNVIKVFEQYFNMIESSKMIVGLIKITTVSNQDGDSIRMLLSYEDKENMFLDCQKSKS